MQIVVFFLLRVVDRRSWEEVGMGERWTVKMGRRRGGGVDGEEEGEGRCRCGRLNHEKIGGEILPRKGA